MNLNDCIREGKVRKVEPDLHKVSSLLETAEIKEEEVNKNEITLKNVRVYVAWSYDVLREVIDAVCLLNGYKVDSHYCIGLLMKDLFEDFDFESFDQLRWVRNGINYYGKDVDFEQGKGFIKKCFEMKKRLKENFLEDNK